MREKERRVTIRQGTEPVPGGKEVLPVSDEELQRLAERKGEQYGSLDADPQLHDIFKSFTVPILQEIVKRTAVKSGVDPEQVNFIPPARVVLVQAQSEPEDLERRAVRMFYDPNANVIGISFSFL